MWRHLLSFVILLSASTVLAREGGDNWIEVRSPHFLVLSDGSDKQARHVAGQFERMRAVFQATFPRSHVDTPAPIIVIALKNRKDFQALEPEAYLAKGQLDLAGLFLRAQDKNYVLLRLDVQGDHPYATVYHEYTHLLLSDMEEWLPLWLNEGLAEFFQNTEIRDKDSQLGEPSTEDVLYLRQNRLLPLKTLFSVDAKSPYYHEEQKASVFYAESWALTHFLQITDNLMHTRRLTDYVDLVSRHVDPVTAGERAFGDLGQMQKSLEAYIALPTFRYFRVPVAVVVDENTFQSTVVPLSQADAIRADFLAYNGREKDARALLDVVLKDDPKSAPAHETMGFIEFQARDLEAARKWYEQAVQLDSQSYLAHYYYAAISMQSGSGARPAEIEASLQATIKLNPRFAPGYDSLAHFYAMNHTKLDEAHLMNLRAVALDPANLGYRFNTASVLQEANRDKDALAVLKAATGLAKTPEEAATLDGRIKQLEQREAVREPTEGSGRPARPEYSGDATKTSAPVAIAPPKHPAETQHGPKQIAKGVIKDVRCTDPSTIEFEVTGGARGVALFSNNYYDIPFSAVNFTPEGEIHPCTDLEGMKASIQYFATADKTVDGQILSVELSK